MKKVLSITLLVAVGAFIVFMTGCEDGEPPGEVKNLTLVATADGGGVTLSWGAPDDVVDPTYNVYFEGTLLLDEITALEYTDSDPGKAGTYKVTVTADGDESDGVTIDDNPIDVKSLSAWELNGSGKSGIGFNISGEDVVTYSMATNDDADKIDCYFTNFTGLSGGFGTPYYLASPDEVTDDPGDPTGGQTGWRTSVISDPLGNTIDNITSAPATGYYNYTEVTVNETYAVETQDDNYGLVEVTAIDDNTGEVNIKATVQLVVGLRLF